MLWTLEEGEEPPALEDYTKDSPTFSLNAISGVTKRNMMKVRVKIAGTFIVALLDSGSSDNFINVETTRDLGLQMTPLKDLRVRVTNGDCLSALGVCEAVPFTKESNSFSATLFVLPLAGFQMVLGTEWLKYRIITPSSSKDEVEKQCSEMLHHGIIRPYVSILITMFVSPKT
nr:uncharacterized protein LOC109160849 [Ipomoea trifida]